MKAKFICESINDILKPKSKSELIEILDVQLANYNISGEQYLQ
jgi:hypothetical protein